MNLATKIRSNPEFQVGALTSGTTKEGFAGDRIRSDLIPQTCFRHQTKAPLESPRPTTLICNYQCAAATIGRQRRVTTEVKPYIYDEINSTASANIKRPTENGSLLKDRRINCKKEVDLTNERSEEVIFMRWLNRRNEERINDKLIMREINESKKMIDSLLAHWPPLGTSALHAK